MNIRNVGIIAHVDAGKTTITENMLYISGRIRSVGSVDKGTAHTDWLDVERERGISVLAAATSFPWNQTEINLLDTPGHVDFASEVERSLRVLDGAIIVLSAVEGIQAQTEVLWKALKTLDIPTLIFINKLDRIGADSLKVLEEIKTVLTPDAIPLQIVKGEGTAEITLTDMLDIPGTSEYTELVERLSDRDERLLERFIADMPIGSPEVKQALKRMTHNRTAHPVLFGSALKGIGVEQLLDAIVEYMPAPQGSPHKPLSGIVFKLGHDRTMGRVAYVRLYDGSLKNREAVYNYSQKKNEKVTQIRKVYSDKYEDIGYLSCGDIAGICGLGNVKIGDILGAPDPIPPECKLATPLLQVQAMPSEQSDYTALVAALQELAGEDPLLDLQWLKDERELHVKIMGVIQLEVLTSILKSRFGLEVTFGSPSVIYKETPSTISEGFVSYTMPKPCWAVLRFKIEPGDRGSGIVYSSQARDDRIAYRYQNQVEKTLPTALRQGPLGWEVTDAKITLLDGEHHVMHTHPLDFVVATPMGIMDGLVKTGTTLLEPMTAMRISVPEEFGGKIINDILQMRGTFDSPVIIGQSFIIEARVPVATSLEYPVRLSSLTSGKGAVTVRFDGYSECSLENGKTCDYRGINPLDRAKYILYARSALQP